MSHVRFVSAGGRQPGATRPVPGALLYTRYNPVKRWMMKRIVRKAGGDTDTTRDYEYTDWNEVRAFADEFNARVRDVSGSSVHPARGLRLA